jgi:hypothetical protein
VACAARLSIVELRVDPRSRRQVGSALLRELLPGLQDRGGNRILGEGVTVGGDGEGWSRTMGFTEVNRFILQTLPVTDANRERWRTVPVAAGYRLRRWVGHAPDDLLSSYARAPGGHGGRAGRVDRLPRFGLDVASEDGSDLSRGAGSWNDLSWGHLVPVGGSLDDITHAVARTPLPRRTPATLDGLSWGRNAAHMAAITWQRPYRVLIHADLLLPA